MAGSQDGEAPARRQVTDGRDACAGGGLNVHLAPAGEFADAGEPGRSSGRGAGNVQAGSGNVQVSNFPGDLKRTNPAAAPLAPASGAAGFPAHGHAFISYVREDSGEVDTLQRLLETAEIPVWRDTASLWPGEDWRARIRDAITRDALVFIACFSSHNAARRASYQNAELLLAIDQLRLRRPDDPWLVPVRFDDCEVPGFELGADRTLASIQRADLFGPGRDLAAGRLVAAVLRLLRQSPSLAAEPSAPDPLVAIPGVASGTCAWIVDASPRLWLRSGPGFSCPTVGWLDYGQRAYGNCAGVESGGTTWYLLHRNGDGWAWGNSAYLKPA
jgi:TIR domain